MRLEQLNPLGQTRDVLRLAPDPQVWLIDDLLAAGSHPINVDSIHRAGEICRGQDLGLGGIGDLPALMRVNLLRFLQEHRVHGIGGSAQIELDLRVIAATNVDLDRAVQEGRFREDLFYRLNVLGLRLPPLRERIEDIDPLADHISQTYRHERRHPGESFSQDDLTAMRAHCRPGNVRELVNRVRRALIVGAGCLIGAKDLGLDQLVETGGTLEDARCRAEREAVRRAFLPSCGNVSQAVRRLNVARSTMYRLIRKLGLGPRAGEPPAARASVAGGNGWARLGAAACAPTPSPVTPLRLRHRRRSGATSLGVAAALWVVSGTCAAGWIAGAQTVSALDTWVSLAGSHAILAANPDAFASVATQSGAVSLATTVRATQEALGLPLTASNAASLYWADASVDLSMTAAYQVALGGALGPGEPLAIFHGSHATAAVFNAAEPVFARAGTISQGVLDGIILRAPGPSRVEVAWDLDLLGLTAIPTGALAYVSDRVELLHVTATGTERIGVASFLAWLEDGKATLQFVDDFGSTSFEAHVGEQLSLSPGRLPAVSLPLPVGVESLALRVVNTHTAVSVAAAPRATVPVLAGAGYLSQAMFAPDREAPRMYWDPGTGSLGFDPIPIFWSGGVLTPTADDPLFSGGQIEITGLRWVGSTDGRRYFAGGTLTLRDRFGTPLLSASLPDLVFEDSLFTFHGLNGFAPILQMLEVQAHRSDWLDGFVDLMGLTAPYLPEIFLGFDRLALGEDPWTGPFHVPVSGLLSFAGAASPLDLYRAPAVIPLPGTAGLVVVGLALVVRWCTGWGGRRGSTCAPRPHPGRPQRKPRSGPENAPEGANEDTARQRVKNSRQQSIGTTG